MMMILVSLSFEYAALKMGKYRMVIRNIWSCMCWPEKVELYLCICICDSFWDRAENGGSVKGDQRCLEARVLGGESH